MFFIITYSNWQILQQQKTWFGGPPIFIFILDVIANKHIRLQSNYFQEKECVIDVISITYLKFIATETYWKKILRIKKINNLLDTIMIYFFLLIIYGGLKVTGHKGWDFRKNYTKFDSRFLAFRVSCRLKLAYLYAYSVSTLSKYLIEIRNQNSSFKSSYFLLVLGRLFSFIRFGSPYIPLQTRFV